jgi:hypothetical protein
MEVSGLVPVEFDQVGDRVAVTDQVERTRDVRPGPNGSVQAGEQAAGVDDALGAQEHEVVAVLVREELERGVVEGALDPLADRARRVRRRLSNRFQYRESLVH